MPPEYGGAEEQAEEQAEELAEDEMLPKGKGKGKNKGKSKGKRATGGGGQLVLRSRSPPRTREQPDVRLRIGEVQQALGQDSSMVVAVLMMPAMQSL